MYPLLSQILYIGYYVSCMVFKSCLDWVIKWLSHHMDRLQFDHGKLGYCFSMVVSSQTSSAAWHGNTVITKNQSCCWSLHCLTSLDLKSIWPLLKEWRRIWMFPYYSEPVVLILKMGVPWEKKGCISISSVAPNCACWAPALTWKVGYIWSVHIERSLDKGRYVLYIDNDRSSSFNIELLARRGLPCSKGIQCWQATSSCV